MTPARSLLLILLASPVAFPQAPTISAPVRITADTQRATPGGATFTVPAGWSIRTGMALVVLEPPEPDTHLAIVDVQAAGAAAAVAAAWTAYRPEVKRPLQLASQIPARNGWDESHIFNYETSPNERALVQAQPRRAGNAWTVVIIDGTEPAVFPRYLLAKIRLTEWVCR